ncbi:hypothetical protein BDV18DRAFT_137941 [Aspergillus unguis]
MHGKTIQGTDLTAITWPRPELRVYYQAGTKAPDITEWLWGETNGPAVGGNCEGSFASCLAEPEGMAVSIVGRKARKACTERAWTALMRRTVT